MSAITIIGITTKNTFVGQSNKGPYEEYTSSRGDRLRCTACQAVLNCRQIPPFLITKATLTKEVALIDSFRDKIIHLDSAKTCVCRNTQRRDSSLTAGATTVTTTTTALPPVNTMTTTTTTAVGSSFSSLAPGFSSAMMSASSSAPRYTALATAISAASHAEAHMLAPPFSHLPPNTSSLTHASLEVQGSAVAAART